ncbi:MAG: Mut7-C RNAse domain-containing protein [Chloroflexi bacterium]|nr:Mut7-C RNAse domain-containing protein [Chloroflexota bacterium]
METRFVADSNVGKLAKWLRIIGYDVVFANSTSDDELIALALSEGRVVLTRDTHIIRRRVATRGPLRVIFIRDDDVRKQLRQVVQTLKLDWQQRPFSLCLQCNEALVAKSKDEVRGLVPPYVFQTQDSFMECPACYRIYWRGTHWQRMNGELSQLLEA